MSETSKQIKEKNSTCVSIVTAREDCYLVSVPV